MPKPRPMNELADSGLLWLINRSLFNPRGFVLTIQYNESTPTWAIHGNGTGVFNFRDLSDKVDEDALLFLAEQTLDEYRTDDQPEETTTAPEEVGVAALPKPKIPIDLLNFVRKLYSGAGWDEFVAWYADPDTGPRDKKIEQLRATKLALEKSGQ